MTTQAFGSRRAWRLGVTAVFVLSVVVVAIAAWLNFRDESPIRSEGIASSPTPAQIERGRYLALAGNCAGCHTAAGGAPMAGGVPIATPFGTIVTSNITPDPATGIGAWNTDHFWRALHNGRSKDGRLLYPAFPYPSYTAVTREDADDLFAWLRTVPPVTQPNQPHALRFPYDTQLALGAWRAVWFTPGVFVAKADRPAEWNRGAYLVEGLGHCAACHASRNALGATSDADGLGGGLIPMQGWYAPPLANLDPREVVTLLSTGMAAHGAASGPMADVVHDSTQHLTIADLTAMAGYLETLPRETSSSVAPARNGLRAAAGKAIYDKQCASCHGADGEGHAGVYPPLAGNPTVDLASSANVIQMILRGGFAAATTANPRPYSMPPFRQQLDTGEIASVASYIRGAWGNTAGDVSEIEVRRLAN